MPTVHVVNSREEEEEEGGGWLTCDGGGLAGVKGSVGPAVVADGGWGDGLSSSPLYFVVLFSFSIFCSLCQQGFFPLCNGCVASLLFVVDHSGGGEARRQRLRFFLLPRVCCLCQQRPPLSVVVVLLIAHGAGGNRGTGGAIWPVVLLPFSALSSISGLLCSSYLSLKSSSLPPVCFPSLFDSVSSLSVIALLLSSSPFLFLFSSVLSELHSSQKQTLPSVFCSPPSLQFVPPFSIYK